MVRRSDVGGCPPALYGRVKMGHATVSEHELRGIGLEHGFQCPIQKKAVLQHSGECLNENVFLFLPDGRMTVEV